MSNIFISFIIFFATIAMFLGVIAASIILEIFSKTAEFSTDILDNFKSWLTARKNRGIKLP